MGVITTVLVLVAFAGLVWPVRARTPWPLAALIDRSAEPALTRADSGSTWVVRSALAAALAGAVAVATRTPTGIAAAVGIGVVAYRLMASSASRTTRAEADFRRRQLPVAIDVLVLMLRTGSAPTAALVQAASVVTGPLAADLTRLAALQLMGTSAREVWQEATADPVLGQLAGAATRSAHSGAALADSWAKVAADLRAERSVRNEVLARRAGVTVLAPLGLCFLPAFICLGVVPIVIGLASDVFG